MAEDRPEGRGATLVPTRPRAPQQLSATDASFLLQERGNAHMHIGAVAVFEGPAPDHRELLAHVDGRLDLVPRFRQKLAELPLGLIRPRPWWIDDPDFNLDYHLRRSSLPRPGTDQQLHTMVSRIFSQRLDRGRPLWEMYVVEGLQDNRFALITKAHHALVDGISGVDLASVILDVGREPADHEVHREPWLRRPAPSMPELLARGALDSLRTPIALAEETFAALAYPTRLRQRLGVLSEAVSSVGAQLLDSAPQLPLNGPIGPHRRFESREVSLETVRKVKQRHDATVNDVVLATVTGALRTWLQGRGIETKELEVRALVPVNLRSENERGLLGSRVALLRASLPVYEDDPDRRLELVRDTMREVKRSRQLAAAQTIIGLSHFAPPTILAQASRLNFSTRLFNLIVTNVPGPQMPLYLLGKELRTIAPIAFLPSGHALAVGIFSYNGTINFGLLGDRDRMDDLDALAEGLEASIGEWTPGGRSRGQRPASVA